MRLTDIEKYSLLRSGQYIVGDIASACLDHNQTWMLVEQELLEYQRFFPLTKRFNIKSTNGTFYRFDFTDDPNNVGRKLIGLTSTVTGAQTEIVQAAVGILGQYSVSIAGTITVGDVIDLTFSGYGINEVISYTTVLADTPITVAAAIVVLINANPNLFTPGLTADSVGSMITGNAVIDKGDFPETISKFVPVGQQQTIANWLSWRSAGGILGGIGSPSRVTTPRMVLRNYADTKPFLYMSEYGTFDILANYRYPFEISYQELEITEVDIPDITTKDKIFLNLCTARIMEAIGMGRNAFVQTDLPITTNASDLITRADDLHKNTTQEMWDRSEFFKGIIP